MEEIKGQGAAQEKGQIRLDSSAAQTSYSNFLLVQTGAEEFVLTFGVALGEENLVRVANRIVLSPKNAKRLLAGLSQAVRVYEEKIGPINIAPPSPGEGAKK